MKYISILTAALLTVFNISSCTGQTRTTTADPKPSVAAPAKSNVIQWNDPSGIAPDPKVPTIIDFNADWCGPCRRFKPVFEQAAADYAGSARFVSVDVDRMPQLARQFGVSSIPQVTVLFPDGVTRSVVGAMDSETFTRLMSQILAR